MKNRRFSQNSTKTSASKLRPCAPLHGARTVNLTGNTFCNQALK